MSTLPQRTKEQWTRLVLGAIRGCTPHDADIIAERCLEKAGRGEKVAVWHESSLFYGHRCHCYDCAPSLGRAS